MDGISTKALAAGFIAAALSVLVFHQGAILVLWLIGLTPNFPWSFRGNQIGVPLIINSMFWGGLWGLVYAYFKDKWPSPALLGGVVFGILCSTIIGGWIVVALLKGNPMFAGFAPLRMLISALIGGMFGLGTAFFYPHVAQRLG
jgi:hypothetical protein